MARINKVWGVERFYITLGAQHTEKSPKRDKCGGLRPTHCGVMGPKEGPVCWSGVGNDTQTNLFASKNLLMKENGDEQDKEHCQPKERMQ